MLIQQRVTNNKIIKETFSEIREVIEEQMNEYREQNSRENKSLQNIMLQVNESTRKLDKRLQNL